MLKKILNLLYMTIVFCGFLNICASLYYWQIIGTLKYVTVIMPLQEPYIRVWTFIFYLLFIYWSEQYIISKEKGK